MQIVFSLIMVLVVTAACAQDRQRPAAAEATSQASPSSTAASTTSGERQQQAAAVASSQPKPVAFSGKAIDVAKGLEHPWGLAFLPDGQMLVTERPGRLRIVSPAGAVSQPLAGVPEVYAQRQGGLLDVVVDPQFPQNRTIYLSYAEAGPDGTSGTAVARARLGDGKLENVQVIYRQEPKVASGGHFGSRIVLRGDGTLFITQGDRMSDRFRDQAQDLRSLIGKVVRVGTDGSIPRDNPFVGRDDARPEIWSYGHRNIQSAVIDRQSGTFWTVEHGPRGGDEVNLTEAGKNYGWPLVSWGVEYSGREINQGRRELAGTEQPVYYWTPVIAPSGMEIYTGDRYPGWRGSLLIGSLTPGGLVRLILRNGRVVGEERYLEELGRVRDVEQGPDGLVYVITDERNGRIVRLQPGG